MTRDEIEKHLDSLVSIGDCTGARTYALLIGDKPLGERIFASCAGIAPPPPPASSPAPSIDAERRRTP